jgi:hypothetical protein
VPTEQPPPLQVQRPGFDSRRYQILREVVGLERGPLSLGATIEELLGRKSSGSGLENREYGRRDPSCWPRCILYPQKLILSSPASGGRSVVIVGSRTEATELLYHYNIIVLITRISVAIHVLWHRVAWTYIYTLSLLLVLLELQMGVSRYTNNKGHITHN